MPAEEVIRGYIEITFGLNMVKLAIEELAKYPDPLPLEAIELCEEANKAMRFAEEKMEALCNGCS